MNAAAPPAFCACAMTCKAMVVLPEDSGPKISITRPRGKSSHAQRGIYGNGAAGYHRYRQHAARAQAQHRSLSELLVHLAERGVNGALTRGGIN